MIDDFDCVYFQNRLMDFCATSHKWLIERDSAADLQNIFSHPSALFWLFLDFVFIVHIFKSVALYVLPEKQSVFDASHEICLTYCSYSTVFCYSDAMH